MSSEVAAFEAELKDFKSQLEDVQSKLVADPDNAEYANLKTELEEVITLTETAIAELKPPPAVAAPQVSFSEPRKEKWSKENHPAYQAGYRKSDSAAPAEESQQPTSFSVNDTVSARWVSGDGAYYTARITSITGSKANPVYIVKFKNYGTTETLHTKDIKPLNNASVKRKADGSSPGPTAVSPAPAPNPGVISAAASVNPTLASQAKNEPSKVSDGPARPAKIPRKVKANKELEAGKNKWQEFASKGKVGKSSKKESMFRTGEGVNARGKSNSLNFWIKD
ncbi:MAG: hypothetical protein Q9227_005022 [Pyrenula ochraceoflavens]